MPAWRTQHADAFAELKDDQALQLARRNTPNLKLLTESRRVFGQKVPATKRA